MLIKNHKKLFVSFLLVIMILCIASPVYASPYMCSFMGMEGRGFGHRVYYSFDLDMKQTPDSGDGIFSLVCLTPDGNQYRVKDSEISLVYAQFGAEDYSWRFSTLSDPTYVKFTVLADVRVGKEGWTEQLITVKLIDDDTIGNDYFDSIIIGISSEEGYPNWVDPTTLTGTNEAEYDVEP